MSILPGASSNLLQGFLTTPALKKVYQGLQVLSTVPGSYYIMSYEEEGVVVVMHGVIEYMLVTLQ